MAEISVAIMTRFKLVRFQTNGSGCSMKTHSGSVKNRLPLGCTLTSFTELNWRPKKLSTSTVALFGELGLTSTSEGGRFPRPDVARSKLDL